MTILDVLENAEHNIRVGIQSGVQDMIEVGLSQLSLALAQMRDKDDYLFSEFKGAEGK